MLTSQDLVEEDLDVVAGEWLRGHNDLVKVALHQLRDHVAALPVKASKVDFRITRGNESK